MVGIPPSTTNEWPQNQSNQNAAMMLQASTMEKPSHEQQQHQQQQPLKCPRCDSTNTKFCYYNNYSLSQPRHFCKACKRYWTRGGTLRNVPVGGGCRKNKRVKRPITSSIDISSPFSGTPTANPISSSGSLNSLLFGSPSNPTEMNLSYPRFNTRLPNMDGTVSGYGMQPQFNAVGLGFSSGNMSSSACNSYISNGVDSSRIDQDLLTSKTLLSSCSPIFGNSHSPAMASLLASTLQQHKFINGSDLKAPNNVQVFDSQIANYTKSQNKDMKTEGQWNVPYQSQVEQIDNMTDPFMYWNATTSVGSWHDPTKIGSSSVPSLI